MIPERVDGWAFFTEGDKMRGGACFAGWMTWIIGEGVDYGWSCRVASGSLG